MALSCVCFGQNTPAFQKIKKRNCLFYSVWTTNGKILSPTNVFSFDCVKHETRVQQNLHCAD